MAVCDEIIKYLAALLIGLLLKSHSFYKSSSVKRFFDFEV